MLVARYIMSVVPSVRFRTCLYENILRISPVVCVQSICHAAGPAASLCKNLLMIHGPPERSTDLRTCSPTIRRTWRLPCGRNKFYIHPSDRSIHAPRFRVNQKMRKPCQVSAVIRLGGYVAYVFYFHSAGAAAHAAAASSNPSAWIAYAFTIICLPV